VKDSFPHPLFTFYWRVLRCFDCPPFFRRRASKRVRGVIGSVFQTLPFFYYLVLVSLLLCCHSSRLFGLRALRLPWRFFFFFFEIVPFLSHTWNQQVRASVFLRPLRPFFLRGRDYRYSFSRFFRDLPGATFPLHNPGVTSFRHRVPVFSLVQPG